MTKIVSPEFIKQKALLLDACNFRGSRVYHVKNEHYEGLVRIYWSKYSERILIDWDYNSGE